jgi:hypothetical protein
MDPSSRPNIESVLKTPKSWEEPQIVLERLLLVSAQDIAPVGPSFDVGPVGPAVMGPLGTSGGSGGCL